MKKIVIEGMVCSKCSDKIEEKLHSLDGMEEVKVLLEEKTAYVYGKVDEQIIKSAIESEGYEVISIEEVQGIEELKKKKGFFSRFLEKIADVNEKSFGSGKLDCCDSEKKKNKKK